MKANLEQDKRLNYQQKVEFAEVPDLSGLEPPMLDFPEYSGAELPIQYISMVRFGDSGYCVQMIVFGEERTMELEALKELHDNLLDAGLKREVSFAINDILKEPNLETLPEFGSKPHPHKISSPLST